jgi:hypothetical protein
MIRLVLGLVFSAIALAAGAAPHRGSPSPATSNEELPVPPIPPDLGAPYLAAPVPNNGLSAPAPLDARQGPEISPGFYQPKDYNIGQGYLPGSTVQGEQEHRAKPMPSLRLKVPLQ